MAPIFHLRGAARPPKPLRPAHHTRHAHREDRGNGSHAVSRRDPFCNSLPKDPNEEGLVILASLRPASSLNQIRGRSGIPTPDSAKPDHALAAVAAQPSYPCPSWSSSAAPGLLTSKTDERDGVDGARTGISLNEELCQDGCR